MSSTFADLGVPAALCARLVRRGIAEPFPIQTATLPDALAGRDVCGRAPTGSGKTLAFGLTIAARVGTASPRRPRALVLVPTRELAAQVAGEIRALLPPPGQGTPGDPKEPGPPEGRGDRKGGQGRPGRNGRKRRQGRKASPPPDMVLPIYGGAGYGPQRRGLARGAAVVVACPGRLEDLVEQGDVELDGVDLVVLDEADRMADMGFLPAVRRLLDRTSSDRQTLLFSATLDGDVDTLVRRYQREPVRHESVPDDADAGEVEHRFWRTDRAGRAGLAAELVNRHGRAIVFSRTRHGADRLARQLSRAGVTATAIHGDRSQGQRERALSAFAKGKVSALVATDVAARGIHVDDVACVVHYDLPADPKDYIHRSGRTGRAGASGVVVSFVLDDDRRSARTLQRALGFPETLHTPDVITGRPPREPASGEVARPVRQGPGKGTAERRRKASRSGRGKPHGKPSASSSGTKGRDRPGGRPRRNASASRSRPGRIPRAQRTRS